MLDPKLVAQAKVTLTKPRTDEEFEVIFGETGEDAYKDDEFVVRDSDDREYHGVAAHLTDFPGCCGIQVLNGFHTPAKAYTPEEVAATVLAMNEICGGVIKAVTNATQTHAAAFLTSVGFQPTLKFKGHAGSSLTEWTLDMNPAPTPKKAATRRR